jgi:iron complex transport system substrate-binding protein
MQKKIILISLFVGLWLTACASSPSGILAPLIAPHSNATPIRMTDGFGTAVVLPAPATRIISMVPGNTEILFAVGAGAQMVGRDELSNFPAESTQATSIGSTYQQLNTEAIVSLHPDLILAAETTPAEQITSLQNLHLTVYRLNNPKTFEDLYQNLLAVGLLTGHTQEASALADSLRQRVRQVETTVAKRSGTPVVFYEMDASDPTKPWTAGPGSFVDMLITTAGGKNVGDSLPSEWAQMSAEQLVLSNPEIILLGSAAYGVTVETVKQRAGWQALTAVKRNAVYPVDDTIVTRPGPRLVDALEQFAKLLHPALYP